MEVNWKCIKDLNIASKAIKHLEDNIEEKQLSISVGSGLFWICHQRHKQQKQKINKQAYTKLKSFCTARETINKIIRQLTKWEKTLTNDMSIYKYIYIKFVYFE